MHGCCSGKATQCPVRKRNEKGPRLSAGPSPGPTGDEPASIALLALVLIPVMFDARDAQPGHARAVNRPLPAGKFLEAQRVALTSLVDTQKPTRDSGNHL